ncbi:AEC family transporter [Actinoplanes couchii]|uniref:Membrane protein n=1 Tax=Actinoplanes couchii TaxID=403638 RepID=A0ABQ3XQE8_9ACTN|nr:AEC family transporter [Actinoplanes couchii]MDR6317431.1 putative permease [Actinoplanes couchii]GID60732.1 membrane protein [Actinoplanes couchii]
MGAVLSGFTTIWLISALGYVLARGRVLGDEAPRVLARLVFSVATPALLFATLSRTSLDRIVTGSLVAFVASTVLVSVVYALVAKLVWKRDTARATIGALGASYVNAGNLGLAVAAYVLGDVSLVVPVLLFQVLFYAPFALTVLDLASGQGKPSLKRLALIPARNPLMIASAAGIAVAASGWTPPALFLEPFELVGAAAVPAALLAFGMSLPGARPLRAGPESPDRYLAVALKILVQPLAAYAIGKLILGLTDVQVFAAVITSALPTAQNVFVFALRYRQSETLARDVIVLSTPASALVMIVAAVFLT